MNAECAHGHTFTTRSLGCCPVTGCGTATVWPVADTALKSEEDAMDVARCDCCERPIGGQAYYGEDYQAAICAECCCALLGRQIEVLRNNHAGAVEVDNAMVERLRDSLWSTWGAGRQTTDWPTRAQLHAALDAALGGQS